MTAKPTHYHAYLLRLWREDEHKPWRAELVSPHTGDKHHFAHESDLFTFLAKLLTTETPGDPDSE